MCMGRVKFYALRDACIVTESGNECRGKIEHQLYTNKTATFDSE